jgi:hypothetical protein
MANRPSHAVQQRILAFLASKPDRQIFKAGNVENCTTWLAKRLSVPERVIVSELDALEAGGQIKISRNSVRNGLVDQIQLVHGVEPEPWAEDEVNFAEEQEGVRLPADLDYRKLADSVLLAALEVMSSSDEREGKAKAQDDEIAALTETNTQLRSQLGLAKAERDTALREKKEAEGHARSQKNRADEASALVAEYESDVETLRGSIKALEEELRGNELFRSLDPGDRQAAGIALSRLISREH